ncbi:MAG: hypothetical protein RMJ56_01860, partial [Gemmataceae bacterium]|nr:hypothetical protein [Gemmataceae bacterium]
DIQGCFVQAHVHKMWHSEQQLPTGDCPGVTPELDFRQARILGMTPLDHVFTDVNGPSRSGEMVELANMSHPAVAGVLRVLADSSFRELVLFTPPHRQALAIEPYTCAADAANLAARGVDCGWRVLDRDAVWHSVVEYRWEDATAR